MYQKNVNGFLCDALLAFDAHKHNFYSELN